MENGLNLNLVRNFKNAEAATSGKTTMEATNPIAINFHAKTLGAKNTDGDNFTAESATGTKPETEDGVDIGKLFKDFMKSLDKNGDGKISKAEAGQEAPEATITAPTEKAEAGSIEEKVDDVEKAVSDARSSGKNMNSWKANAAIVDQLKDLKGQDLQDFITAYEKKNGEGSFATKLLKNMQWGVGNQGKQADIDFDTFRRNLLDLGDTFVDNLSKQLEDSSMMGTNESLWLREGIVYL